MSTQPARPVASLPKDANLQHLKHQAKDLQKAFQSGVAAARERVKTAKPKLARSSKLLLSDAQFVIAREYGFESWPKLKHFVEGDVPKLLINAVNANDVKAVHALLRKHPELKSRINEPLFGFDAPAIVAKSGQREMVDVLLEAGADINAMSKWWAGGFGVLHSHTSRGEHGQYLVSRGARVDAHAAANLNLADALEKLIDADSAVVNQRGPDGMVPLHMAATPAIAKLLLDRGAEVDTRDIDHESTPAQYAIPHRPEVCRYLLNRGAQPDIFMACVLGDVALVTKLIKDDPSCLQHRIAKGQFVTTKSEGQHIYVYNLGYTQTPLTLAHKHGHSRLLNFLLKHCSLKERFFHACSTADQKAVNAILKKEPFIAATLTADEASAIADAAWNNDLAAVRTMLEAGFPVDARGIHQSTPLDRAAIRGYIAIVELLLEHGASLDVKNEFGGTPLRASKWGAENFRDPKGDYPAVIARLTRAGAKS